MKLLLIAVVLFFSGVGYAKSNSCLSLFQENNISNYINNANFKYNKQLTNTAFESELLNLKKRYKKKADRILDRVTKEGLVSEKDLERTAEEMVILLFGQRDLIDNYFLKNSSERAKSSVQFQLRKKIISEGLSTFLENHPLKLNYWIKLKRAIRIIHISPLNELTQFPFSIPRLSDRRASEHLLFKIAWEGSHKHKEEISHYFKTQNLVEFYSAARKVYLKTGLAIIGVFASLGAYNYVNSEFLAKEPTNAELNAKYKMELQKFELEVGRSPSAEEAKTIKDFIFE